MLRHERRFAGFRCVHALAWCCAWALVPAAWAATLTEAARKENCTDRPVSVGGGTIYKCTNKAGYVAYFNVDGGAESPSRPANGKTVAVPPSGFPRVDAETQKGRDDLRRRVLTEELAAEEKLLAKARIDYGTGSPPPLPEERSDAQKYADRIARLRQTVQLHERNVEALKKELASGR